MTPPPQGLQQIAQIPELFLSWRLPTVGRRTSFLLRRCFGGFLFLALPIPLHPPLREAGEDKEDRDEPLHGGGDYLGPVLPESLAIAERISVSAETLRIF